jgi:membrane-bound inhibitor of C-type lysozyme
MYINELAGDFQKTAVRSIERTSLKTDAISTYIASRKSLRIETTTANELNVSAFSMDGKELFSGTYRTGSGTKFIEIPLNTMKPGMYLFKYESDNTIKTERLNVL